MMSQQSLHAYYDLNLLYANRCYQQILGILSDDRPRTREQIEYETGIKGNTLRPRIRELQEAGLVTVQGEGKTSSGRRAEKIGLHSCYLTQLS